MRELKPFGLMMLMFLISLNVFTQEQEKLYEWHFDPGNKVMKDGHKKIREYYKAREKEQIAKGFYKNVAKSNGTIEAPIPLKTDETYANGLISGKWSVKKLTHTTSTSGYGAGVRFDRTVYDPVDNHLYALNTSKNLLDGKVVNGGTMQLRNHKIKLFFESFVGVRTNDNIFRLIGAPSGFNKYYYSDDKGVTWTESSNSIHIASKVIYTEVLENKDVLAIVEKNINNVRHIVILKSTDYGASFTTVNQWEANNIEATVATKLYNKEDEIIIIQKSKSIDEVKTYIYNGTSVSLIATNASDKKPLKITGTFYEGKKHVYFSVEDGGGYYSNNGAETLEWRATIKDKIETVDPENPNFLISRKAKHDYSEDGGITWKTWPSNNATIGWDPKHITYYKINDTWTLTAANDMGFAYNSNPLNENTWQYVNDNHTHAILHGGMTVDFRNVTVTGNQDPGTFEQLKTGEDTFSSKNRRGADGLIVAASNDGKSYWFRHYWKTFFHANANFTNNNEVKAINDLGKDWYTPPFVGSTKPNEDAIFVSGYDKIWKLTYDSSNREITKTELPVDFKVTYGDKTMGIAIAKTDHNRMYVATNNKRFFFSKDGGQTWRETSFSGAKPTVQGPNWGMKCGYHIKVSDKDPNIVVWAGGKNNNNCLISYDGGMTFTPLNNNRPTSNVGPISLSPKGDLIFSRSGKVYISSENQWFDLKGDSWPTGADANAVDYLPLQRKVRFFTWGAGIVDFDITNMATEVSTDINFNSTKTYKIINKNSDLVLGVENGGTTEGLSIKQQVWQGEDHQLWTIERQENGFFIIKNVKSGKVIDVFNKGINDGGYVIQSNLNSSESQQWNFYPLEEDSFHIVSKNSVKLLEVFEASTEDGANINQWTVNNNASQKWKFELYEETLSVDNEFETKNKLFNVYPNPSSALFNVVLETELILNKESIVISVENIIGQQVIYLDNIEDENTVLDLSKFSDGVYLIKVKKGKLNSVRKIIKKSN